MSPQGSASPGAGAPDPSDRGGEPKPMRWALMGFVVGLIGGFIVTLLYLMIR